MTKPIEQLDNDISLEVAYLLLAASDGDLKTVARLSNHLTLNAIVRLMLDAPRVSIADAEPPAAPGVYLLHGRDLEDLLGPEVGHGELAAYDGSTSNLRTRRNTYRRRFERSDAFGPENFTFSFVETPPDLEGAAEKRLMRLLQPVLNGSGLGANTPGSGRLGVSGYNVFDLVCGDRLPKRHSPKARDKARAQMRLLAEESVTATDVRWPALRPLPTTKSRRRPKKAA